MKKFLLLVSIILFFMIVVPGLYMAHAIISSGAPGPLAQDKIVLIERGNGVSSIGNILAQHGVIKSAFAFKLATKIDQDQRPLKAGEYLFPSGISLRKALEMMREGEVYDRKVTFPEGVTSWQVIETLKGLADMSGDLPEIPPEGTLLPETYHYINQQDRAGLVGQMKEAMDKVLADAWASRTEGLPFATPQEALTLASIVEKETGVPSERKRVAGVFINRLKQGIPLQSDPTVIYAMTKGQIQNAGQGPIGRRLLTNDLKSDSPYNTYIYAGLPPGPIANPGRESIDAVLHPEVHDFIYFVADGTGGHVFSKTLSEHNSNVAKWRKIRKEQRQ
ncbi:MAG: endolytic transglycosylase MltG [Micavibrio aeruginosavorus]|uniref:Endolytic murein transglycosylase n=1 Tax=Micavibrio aeruginosavorus TaxID=349221 RepID=A0A2W5MWD0_9BACT|nr:MAG: endolytic transglycosylase MltG [Micavibrio aeruginosavorus]